MRRRQPGSGRRQMLDHRKSNCTGEWRLVMDGGERQLICEHCGARYVATPARRKAAVDENLAGTFLRRLAEEGAGSPEWDASELDDVA